MAKQADRVWGEVWNQNVKTAKAQGQADEWEARLKETQARSGVNAINSGTSGNRPADRDPIEDARRTAELRKQENDIDANRNYAFRDQESQRDLERWSIRQASMEAAQTRQYDTQKNAAQGAMKNRDRFDV